MKLRTFLLCLASPMLCHAETPYLRVWNFDEGNLTDQGGYYNQFQGGASSAQLSLASDVHRGPHGRALRINFEKQDSGYCGVWLHLFDETKKPTTEDFLSVTDTPYLSFWVKGEKGGENFQIQMADPDWYRKEDSKPAGSVHRYLPDGVSTEWQEVTVPYSDFGLATSRAATIAINFTQPGKGSIYIDDIHFKRTESALVPFSDSQEETPSVDRTDVARAMWVWHNGPLLTDDVYRAEFFTFCADHAITELFLQMPYHFEDEETEDVTCVIEQPDALRAFLKEARVKGLLSHALDGYPEFVLRSHRPRVLAQVRAVLDFNKESGVFERFHGIHLDNEPYQLLGFQGAQRKNILIQLLELNDVVMAMLRDAGSDLVYGIDMPFWFDEGADGKESGWITYKGVRQDAAKHLIDVLDNVGIMDYRNVAGSADGMIRHGEDEIAYANDLRKKIYIGLETFKHDPITIHYVYGVTLEEWWKLGEAPAPYQLSSKVDGFKVRALNTGKYMLVGLAEPEESTDHNALEAALEKLYVLYGATARGRSNSLSEVSSAAEVIIKKDGRYTGFTPYERKDEAGEVVAAGFTTTEDMLDKITFAGMTKTDVEAVLKEVQHAFAGAPSFHGFAIHFYQTYRDLPD